MPGTAASQMNGRTGMSEPITEAMPTRMPCLAGLELSSGSSRSSSSIIVSSQSLVSAVILSTTFSSSSPSKPFLA